MITPEDIIKRCLWTKYRKLILKDKKEDEVNEIIKKNELTLINEHDAYVIGLLKVVETENLTHRFKIDIEEFIGIKSTINNKEVMINKSTILKEIIEFKNRFPEAYKPDQIYEESIEDMKKFVASFYDKINELEEKKFQHRDKTYTYVLSSKLVKLLKKSKDWYPVT